MTKTQQPKNRRLDSGSLSRLLEREYPKRYKAVRDMVLRRNAIKWFCRFFLMTDIWALIEWLIDRLTGTT